MAKAAQDLARVSEVRKFSLQELRDRLPVILAAYGAEPGRAEQIATALFYFDASVQLTPEFILYEAPKRGVGESESHPALWMKSTKARV